MLNRWIGIGRLTAEPELRYTPTGKAVTTFRVAIDRPYTGPDGKREADFIQIVTWNKLAETCANHLSKGRLVAVDGRLQIREYEHEGQRRRATEIIAETVRFLDRPKEQDGSGRSGGAPDDDWSDWGPDDEVPF